MLAPVVVFDPDDMLPASFAADVTSTAAVTSVRLVERVTRATAARRLARRARVVVIVTGRDPGPAIGLLVPPCEPWTAWLVLFAPEVDRHHHLLLHALRRRAVVLLDQPTSVLVACVRDLMLASPPPGLVA